MYANCHVLFPIGILCIFCTSSSRVKAVSVHSNVAAAMSIDCHSVVPHCCSRPVQRCCSFKCCHRRSFKCCCRCHNNKCRRCRCCMMQLCCITAVLMYSISIPNSWKCDSMGVSLRILLYVGMPCKIPCQQRINPQKPLFPHPRFVA